MAKHKPSVAWALRRVQRSLRDDPIENGYVQTTEDGKIHLTIRPFQSDIVWMVMDRSTARLLARRIEQCLEDTK